ncbi:MAG: hypothetical protein L3J03_09185 [Desulfobacterales bacterium]|nr:hypothetical protein [Desulfobacterales bacterium]
MRWALRFLAIGLVLTLSGCVTAPKQTVELADIVGQQISEMQASHEQFVSLYYAKLRDEAEHFMEQKWTPQFLANVISGTGEESRKFRADLDKAYKLAALDWENTVKIDNVADAEVREAIREAIRKLSTEKDASLGMVLLDFSTAVQEQINGQRRKLLQPIDEQEAFVLDQLRQGYADLLQGNAAIKGYLASTVKLVEQRDAVLEKMGVLETQRRVINTAVTLSDGAATALNTAENADQAAASFLEKMNQAKEKLEYILNREG